MPGWRSSFIALFVVVFHAAAADPGLLGYVPSETKVLFGGNVSRSMTSPFGKLLLSQVRESQPQLQRLAADTGFDPFRDVQELLIVARGDQNARQGLVLARGLFNPAILTAKGQQSGAAVQTYKGVQVLTDKQPSGSWVAFLDSTTAILGDSASVRGAIDRRGLAPVLDAKLRARIEQASAAYDFWFVSTVQASDLAGKLPDGQLSGVMQGDLLKSVIETSGGIKIDSDLLFGLDAVTRSEKDATALADVIRFFAGMVQMNAQKDANMAQAVTFLQRLQLTTQGNVLNISLSVPGAELEKAIEQAQATAKKRAAAPAKPSQQPAPAGGLTIQSSPKDMGTVVVK